MLVTFASLEGASETFDVDSSITAQQVSEFLQAALGLSSNALTWLLHGRAVPMSSPQQPALAALQAAGWSGDVVLVQPAASAAGQRRVHSRANAPVSFPGMTADDVFQHNRNPAVIAQIFRSPEHAQALRELNYHNPDLSSKIRSAASVDEAAAAIREWMLTQTTHGTLEVLAREADEGQMRARLQANPSDEEAKEFFAKRERRARVLESRNLMLQEYPETFARVLMLYIEVTVNGHRAQAFVDSGAETSVMSAAYARKLGLFDIIDEDFAGTVVGVGSSKTLGKIHAAPMVVAHSHFPLSVTVLEDNTGFGDANMKFLMGLDMLKRYRCQIDLDAGCLWFHGASGRVAAPFLHEKDLPKSKGGVRDDDEAGPAPSSAPDATMVPPSSHARVPPAPATANSGAEALMALGYSSEQATRALRDGGGDLETAKTLLMFEPKRGR